MKSSVLREQVARPRSQRLQSKHIILYFLPQVVIGLHFIYICSVKQDSNLRRLDPHSTYTLLLSALFAAFLYLFFPEGNIFPKTWAAINILFKS